MSAVTGLRKLDEFTWEIPMGAIPGMRVPGKVFADEKLLAAADCDRALEQVMNVACLPGIVEASLAMPDIHWGYGFPIGGVAATDVASGAISPGGVGYDISCGVRLVRTSLTVEEAAPRMREILDALVARVPRGLGSRGRLVLGRRETEGIMREGVPALIAKGTGWAEDLEFIEEEGSCSGADPSKVSERAFERAANQVGSLGSGNHFVEIQVVDRIYQPQAAHVLGLEPGQVVAMIHSGSRGLGHQICTDTLKRMGKSFSLHGYELPDRQLACVPVGSPEGADYLSAMACAANFALANREALTEWVREAFREVFKSDARRLGMSLVYDVSHNLAKLERHRVDGKERALMVHRKGATRSFPGSRPEVPAPYREIGQPVIIPGDMGRYSFVLVGTEEALERSFGSTCHGAGRALSRTQARKRMTGRELQDRLERAGILLDGASSSVLAEEAPEAYKDVSEITRICEGAGLSVRVARLRPLAVVKG